jgi:imidazolonepropionase-like amidohydrolase
LFVGSEGEFDTPSGRKLHHVDLQNKTILPGLIDDHIHLALGIRGGYENMMRDSDGIQLITGIINAGQALRAGITTVKDCGARNRVALDLRDGWSRGLFQGPRILVCGRPLCTTGGHFHFCNDNECDGPWEVRKRTRQLLKEGVDFIKLMASGGGTKGTDSKYASFEEQEIYAAVVEAETVGKTVSAHCEAFDSVGRAARAGVHIIQHAGFIMSDGTRGFDEDAVRTMVKKGLYYDPTLQTGSALVDSLREKEKGGKTLTDEERNQLKSGEYKIKRKSENLARMVSMGVKCVAGSDGIGLGNCTRLVRTLELMVDAGMTPLDAIVSATGRSAKATKIDRYLGTLAEGKEADIVAVSGDPTRDISTLRSPVMVMQAGRLI